MKFKLLMWPKELDDVDLCVTLDYLFLAKI